MAARKTVSHLVWALILAMSVATSVNRAQAQKSDNPALMAPTPLGTTITYQGQLKVSGTPANGNYDLRFIVYDSAIGGSQVAGSPILTKLGTPVSQGLLTVPLDFGDIFGNTRLFLEIAVRPGGTAGAYTTLAPRQEITPAPYARYAIKALNADAAQNATAAQSVPWTGITGKPATLSRRRLYVPAGGFGYLPSANIAAANWGLNWKNVTQSAGFAVLRPIDWDPTSSFTVTLYFAIPIASSPGTIIWRLRAGGSLMNLPLGSATTGWDGIYDNNTQDAVPLAYYAAGGHSNLMKAQSWTAKWSSTYNTWYFGSGVNTANDFKRNPMWYFAFQRGNAVTNGESYTGDLLVVGADIAYTAVP